MSLAGTLTNVSTMLLTQFGEAVTLTRQVPGEYNPSTGETLPNDTISYTAFGAPEEYKNQEIDNVTVIQDDIKVTIYKTTQIPLVNDGINIDGIDYRVINVTKVRCQGQNIIFELQVRV